MGRGALTRLGRVLAAALAAAVPGAVFANDSEAAFALGGLTLVESRNISMDAEDLYISREEVRVAYRFTNRSSQDVETLVSFPVPGLPHGPDSEIDYVSYPDFRDLKFTTTIDGRPVKLDLVERAEVAGRDVTARVAALGWKLRWFESYEATVASIEKLSAARKAELRREGLLRPHQDNADTLIPAWKLVTHVTRRQRFPAGRTVAVTHRYRPYTGGSVSGGLFPSARSAETLNAYAREHCTDRDFIASFDRRMAQKGPGTAHYRETWIEYFLKSGANWRGPIGLFRLVIDKGKADSLVSFCMNGVRKISPTRFEVRKRNFEPDRDLDILIVDFHRID